MKLVSRANELISDINKRLDDGSIEPLNEIEWLLIDCRDTIAKLVDDNIRLTDKLIEQTKDEKPKVDRG